MQQRLYLFFMFVPCVRTHVCTFIITALAVMTVGVSSAAAQSATSTADGTLAAPTISSSVFGNPNQWYAPLPGSFSWEVPEDASAVAVELVGSTDDEPMEVYEPPIASVNVLPDDMREGTQYVSVQFRNENGWGDIGYRPLRIDATPPEELYVDVITNEQTGVPTLVFRANDARSGLAGYALYFGTSEPVFITPEAAANGYPLSALEAGTYRVRVVAYDRAGNGSSRYFPVFMMNQNDGVVGGFVGPMSMTKLIAIALGFVAFVTIWIAVRMHIRHRRRIERLRTEMYEVHEQMEKIFKALRDEIHDQVQSITNRSRLSKGEKNVVHNLNRVLETSETLVEKEVQDVKKILKKKK